MWRLGRGRLHNWGSHISDYEDVSFLGCSALWFVDSQQTFRRNISPMLCLKIHVRWVINTTAWTFCLFGCCRKT
jgi:hypothetical protein